MSISSTIQRGVVLALTFAGCEAFAQHSNVEPDMLTYTVRLGFFKPSFEFKKTTTALGWHLYTGRVHMLFDPRTLTFVHLTRPDPNFDPRLKATGDAGMLEVGRRWAAEFEEPPSIQARCNDNTQKTAQVEITGKQIETVKVNGKDQLVEAVVAKVQGTWASCGHSGSYERTTHFVPSLDVFTVGDSVTRLSDGREFSSTQTRLEQVRLP